MQKKNLIPRIRISSFSIKSHFKSFNLDEKKRLNKEEIKIEIREFKVNRFMEDLNFYLWQIKLQNKAILHTLMNTEALEGQIAMTSSAHDFEDRKNFLS